LTKRPKPEPPKFDFSKHLKGKCPICGGEIARDPEFSVWRCLNIAGCPAQSVRRLEFMAQRRALDIESMGGVVSEKLIERGLVKEPLDLFELKINQLGKLNLGTKDEPRIFGEKNATKVVEALERAKTFPLARWLYALGIPNIGETTAHNIAGIHYDWKDVASSRILTGVLEIERLRKLFTEANPGARKYTGSTKEDKELQRLEFNRQKSEFLKTLNSIKAEIDQRAQHSAQLKHIIDAERTDLELKLAASKLECDKTTHEIKKHKESSQKKLPAGLIPKVTQLKAEMLRLEERICKAGIPEEIGPVVCKSILDFFGSNVGKRLLQQLQELQIIPLGGLSLRKTEADIKPHIFSGKTFVLTGSLKSMTRDEASALIREAGGNVTGSVSKNTDFLLAGEEAGSKLDKANELSVKILREKEFLQMLGSKTKPEHKDQKPQKELF